MRHIHMRILDGRRERRAACRGSPDSVLNQDFPDDPLDFVQIPIKTSGVELKAFSSPPPSAMAASRRPPCRRARAR